MDTEEFKSVFLPLGPLLYRLAFRMLGTEEDARDAVQELYVKLCREGDRALRSANPQGYCVRMMQNVCADFLRRGGRNVLRRAADVAEVRGGPAVEAADAPVEGREEAAMVRKALATLPPKLREVVALRDLEQMEMSEIEAVTGMSQVNIRVTLSRGRKMLKEKIEKFIKMDRNLKISELSERFYAGQTSSAEERELADRLEEASAEDRTLLKGLSELRVSDDEIPVPEDLSRTIEQTVDRELGRRRSWMRLVASISSVAAAAVIAAVALIMPVDTYEPKDTFEDPVLAYAETVKALEMVGVNLGKGLVKAGSSMDRAGDMVSKTMESVQSKVNKK